MVRRHPKSHGGSQPKVGPLGPVALAIPTSGQLVIALALGEIIEAMKGELLRLATSKVEQIEAAGQTFTVTLTPDLNDGGYTVQCREIPAALSQGETEQEALDNIVEVLEEHFEYERQRQAQAQAV